jgi:hypothetical protein
VVQDLEAGAGRTTWARMLPVLHALNIHLVPQGPLVDKWLTETKETGS